jgi:hypothetical protein
MKNAVIVDNGAFWTGYSWHEDYQQAFKYTKASALRCLKAAIKLGIDARAQSAVVYVNYGTEDEYAIVPGRV